MKTLATMLVAAVLCTGCVGSLLESEQRGPGGLPARGRGLAGPWRAAAARARGRAAARGGFARHRAHRGRPAGQPLRLFLGRALGGARAADAAAAAGARACGRRPVRHRGGGAEPRSCGPRARRRVAQFRGRLCRRGRRAARQRGDAGHARGRSQGQATGELRGARGIPCGRQPAGGRARSPSSGPRRRRCRRRSSGCGRPRPACSPDRAGRRSPQAASMSSRCSSSA